MHVRKVEIFIYSLFSPAEKLSLPKRLKSDLIPIIRYSNVKYFLIQPSIYRFIYSDLINQIPYPNSRLSRSRISD